MMIIISISFQCHLNFKLTNYEVNYFHHDKETLNEMATK